MPKADAHDRRRDRLFYDGGCGLCHRAVRFVVRRDPDGTRFRFAPLEGETLRVLVSDKQRESLPDSLVVLTSQGRLLYRSAAVVRILRQLSGAWPLVARLLGWLPERLLDGVYDWVARRRHRYFRPASQTCPVLTPEQRERFDP